MNLYKADFKIYLRSAFSQNHKFYQHKKQAGLHGSTTLLCRIIKMHINIPIYNK